MDFFSAQDSARRSSGWLVVLFMAAIGGIVALLYFATEYAYRIMDTGQGEITTDLPFNPERFAIVAGCVVGFVLLASLVRVLTLARGGGDGVATSLGGILVPRSTDRPSHRRLINVVDEMAIASGMPPPNVYVLPDTRTINAFAAGYGKDDAVIGVTQGALDSLSRDELQGVIAHEFSHIIHGDMRLNMRLIGIVFGIAILGYLGYMMMRTSFYLFRSRDVRIGPAVLVGGLVLSVAGYVGVLAGNLIRAAISRQREYLADASAVQYTRNPDGIGSALKKLAVTGGSVAAPSAAEFSHMLFGEGAVSGFSNPLATHPPLQKRIKAVQPDWDGKYPKVRQVRDQVAEQDEAAGYGQPGAAKAVVSGAAVAGFGAALAVNSVGNASDGSREFARSMLGGLRPALRAEIGDPFGARAVIYALLLDPFNDECRRVQIDHLRGKADPQVFAAFERIMPDVVMVPRNQRLSLAELCVPALRGLSESQMALFASNMEALIEADDSLEPYEWCLHTLILHELSHSGTVSLELEKMSRRDAAQYALSALAKFCDDEAEAAYEQATAKHGLNLAYETEEPDHFLLSSSFAALAKLDPKSKRRIIEIAAECAAPHGTASIDAIEILRVFSSILGCPMPPVADG